MVYVNRLDSSENLLPYDYDLLVFLNYLVLTSLLSALITMLVLSC